MEHEPSAAELTAAAEMEAEMEADTKQPKSPVKSSPVKSSPVKENGAPSMPLTSKWKPKSSTQKKLEFPAIPKPKAAPGTPKVEPKEEKKKEAEEKTKDKENVKPKKKAVSDDEAEEKTKHKKKKATSDDEAEEKTKAKQKNKKVVSDDEAEEKTKKKKKKAESGDEADDPEAELKKLKKERMKELVRQQRRKEKKRKRASSYVDDEAKVAADDDEDTDKELAELSDGDRDFVAPEDGEESSGSDASGESEDDEGEKKKKSKDKHKKKKKHRDDEAMEVSEKEAEKEGFDNMMAEAVAAVGSKSAKKNKKKEKAEKGEKRPKGGGRVCTYCDQVIEKGWMTLRGEITGTGNTNCYFHAECVTPFLKESEKLRAEGKKPVTVKKSSKKDEDKAKEKPKEVKKEKGEGKPKEEPPKKKAKVAVDLDKVIASFAKARDGFDRFIAHLIKVAGDQDADMVASELSSFAKSWAAIDKRMQEIEDGKTKDLPDWPFDEKYQRDVIWFYIMSSEHGFKEFKKVAKKLQDKTKSKST